MQSKVHVSRSNRAFLSPTRENGSGSRTEKGSKPVVIPAITCISITDKAKITEQNKSIAVGPFYIGTYFELIWTLLPEDVAVLNPTGYRTL